MKKFIINLQNKQKLLGFLSICIIGLSSIGTNSFCFTIFHDVEKPNSLYKLKKY